MQHMHTATSGATNRRDVAAAKDGLANPSKQKEQ